jgi:RNA polymerase sigma factor (sigma-70 family)
VTNDAADRTDETTLRLALAGLPDRERQVLSLLYLADLDEVDVSEALGISVKSVRKRVERGRAVLLTRMD